MSETGLFEQDPKPLARELVGRTLVYGPTRATIFKATAFPRRDNLSGLYRPMLEMNPGEVYTPRQHNAVLTLIVCKDGEETGACVALDEAEVNGRPVKGKGRVSEALGLATHGATGNVVERDGLLILTMGGVPMSREDSRVETASSGPAPVTRTRLTQSDLRSVMAKLIKIYPLVKGRSPSLTFESWVNALMSEHLTLDALQRHLRTLG